MSRLDGVPSLRAGAGGSLRLQILFDFVDMGSRAECDGLFPQIMVVNVVRNTCCIDKPLLLLIRLSEPVSAVGRSTRDAMISGAVHGYRGLVSEIIRQVRKEAFPGKRPKVIATGGDAELIASGSTHFDAVDPLLTLKGLLVVAALNV